MAFRVVLALVVAVVAMWAFQIFRQQPVIPLTTQYNQTYDYIIVGGGSAGCVLASRLSEEVSARVLLLEAGQDDQGVWELATPMMAAFTLFGWPDYNWFFMTQPQQHALEGFTDRKLHWPRGKVLGGTSNLNAMIYIRGSRHDYDGWANSGLEGWDYDSVLPYILKSEDMQEPSLQNSKYHSTGGPLKVSVPEKTKLGDIVLKAFRDLGFPVTDPNAHTMIGVSPMQATIDSRGVRSSTSRAFLHPVLHRPNLHVGVNALVTKVLIDKSRAIGVEFEDGDRKHVIKATREIILSAGAIGSPQLLMLSGIGPKTHLESLGIPVHADLPVGENLWDHPAIDIGIKVNTTDGITDEKLLSRWENLKYSLLGTGVLAAGYGDEAIAFVGSTADRRQKDMPDVELHMSSAIADWNLMGDMLTQQNRDRMSGRQGTPGITCFPVLLHSASRGTIRLQSVNPRDPPLIDPHYLEQSEDVETLLYGVKTCLKLIETPSLKAVGAHLVDKPIQSCVDRYGLMTDDYWRCLIRFSLFTCYHPAGTCRMGRVDDSTTVVDSQLRVKGIAGLRVVDASVIPTTLSGNPNAAIIMIAEKAADMIRQDLAVGETN